MRVGIGLNAIEGLPVIKEQNRFRHLLCLGASGTGKTTFFAHLIRQELKNACIILDPNGHLTEQIASYVPTERLIYVDKKHPISLNPLTRPYLNWSEAAKELIQVINASVKEVSPTQVALSVLMTRITKNALRVFSKEQMSLQYLMKFLDNSHARQRFNHDSYWKHFDDKGNREQVDSARRVSSRLSLYCDDLDLLPFLAGENALDIPSIAENRKVVIVNLDKFDDEATSFLGCLITNQIKSYYLNQAPKGGTPLFFYCDEFHLFISEHFGRFLAEGRKYNISFNFSGHSFANLNAFFQNMLLASHVKIVLNNDYKDAKILAEALQIKASEIINLPPFKAIARIGNINHRILLYKPPPVQPIKQEEIFPLIEPDYLGDDWMNI